VEVFKSEIVKKTLNPKWPVSEIPLEKLCNNNLDTNLLITCWDWDRMKSDDFMGQFTSTAKALVEAPVGQRFKLKNDKEKKDPGSFVVTESKIESTEIKMANPDYSFLENLILKKKSKRSRWCRRTRGFYTLYLRWL